MLRFLFAALMPVLALTAQQTPPMEELLSRLDRDGDGSITAAEITELLHAERAVHAARRIDAIGAEVDEDLRGDFETFDTNHDDAISKAEFEARLAGARPPAMRGGVKPGDAARETLFWAGRIGPDSAPLLFDLADRDHSDTIERAEFRFLASPELLAHERPYHALLAQHHLTLFDFDGDGFVDAKEIARGAGGKEAKGEQVHDFDHGVLEYTHLNDKHLQRFSMEVKCRNGHKWMVLLCLWKLR